MLWLESGSDLAKECLLGNVPNDAKIALCIKQIKENDVLAKAYKLLDDEISLTRDLLNQALNINHHKGLEGIIQKCSKRGY